MSKERIISPVEAFLSRADGGSAVEFAALVESHGLDVNDLVAANQIKANAVEAIATARLRRQDAERANAKAKEAARAAE